MERNEENNQNDDENSNPINLKALLQAEPLETHKTEPPIHDETIHLKVQNDSEKVPEKVKESNIYNYDLIPPDIGKAKIHGKARKVYARLSEAEKAVLSTHKTQKRCECCGNPYDLERLGICCAKSELYHLGAGFPLYFEFLGFCGVLIIIMLAISGGYNFVTNLLGEDCENNLLLERKDSRFCDPSRISLTSFVNKRYSTDEIEINNWLNLATVVIMLLAFHFHRRRTIFTNREVDNSQQTPADYTITIINLPLKVTDQQIKDFIEKELFYDRKIEIVKIVRGYNIRNYVLLNRRKHKIQIQLLKDDVQNKDKLQKELDSIKKSLDVLENESANSLETSPYVYITFEKEEEAEEALKRLSFDPQIKKLFHTLGCYSCFDDITFQGDVKLVTHRAPEPSDILWENLATAKSEKTKRRMITFFVSYLLIAIDFGIIIGLNVGKDRVSNPKHIEDTSETKSRSFGLEVISVIIALVIMVINNALNFAIRKFAAYESHSTFTGYFISVARRLSLVTFINTAITLFVTHLILQNLWKDGGLLNDVFTVFLITVIIGPLSNVFNPWYFWRLYKRSSIIKQGKACKLTQREANLIFEGPEIDIAQAYANALKTMWLTAFYAPILPIGIPISLVGIFLSYWTDKYLLLNRYAKPSELGKALNKWMTEYLELTPFFFSLGNLVFRRLIKGFDGEIIDETILPTFLALGLSLVHFILPLNWLTKCCFSQEENHSYKPPYSEARLYFNNDYDISNPIYHDDAIENWYEALKKTDQGNQLLKTQLKAELKRDPHAQNPQLRKLNFFNNIRNYAQMNQGLSIVGNYHIQGTVPANPLNFYHHLPQRPLQPYATGQPIVSNPTIQTLQSLQSRPQYPPINTTTSQPIHGNIQPQPNSHVNLNFEQRPPVQSQNPYVMGMPNQQIQPNQPNMGYNPYGGAYIQQQQRFNPQPNPSPYQYQYQGAPYRQGMPQPQPQVQTHLPQYQGNRPIQQFNPYQPNMQRYHQN